MTKCPLSRSRRDTVLTATCRSRQAIKTWAGTGASGPPVQRGTLETEITGFSLALVPSWSVTDRFAFFGKAGVISWDASVSAKSFGQIETLSGEDLLTGAGLRYDFSSGLGLLIEYQEMDLGVVSTALGLRWRF